MTVLIQTKDGKIYTDPTQVHITRDDHELFYSMVEGYVPPRNKEQETKEAST